MLFLAFLPQLTQLWSEDGPAGPLKGGTCGFLVSPQSAASVKAQECVCPAPLPPAVCWVAGVS